MTERLATILAARVATSRQPPSATELAKQTQRFAPGDATPASWLEVVRHTQPIEREELVRRAGTHSWPQYVEKVFPALALGITDAKIFARLTGRDAWTAAIVARALGLWTDGPPPSLAATCDAYVWQRLGLAGKPKRCPPEVRAVFFGHDLGIENGPPDRLLRLYAAKQLGAPRPELRALRDALVRIWIAGKHVAPPAFADEVRDAARIARDGVFGDRKVFIAAVWNGLRQQPAWSAITLDDFKARLVTAHRAGDLVLARADLVAAMNPELVAASETRTDGASFHFIVREEP